MSMWFNPAPAANVDRKMESFIARKLDNWVAKAEQSAWLPILVISLIIIIAGGVAPR